MRFMKPHEVPPRKQRMAADGRRAARVSQAVGGQGPSETLLV